MNRLFLWTFGFIEVVFIQLEYFDPSKADTNYVS